jgi:hypothetical protein
MSGARQARAHQRPNKKVSRVRFYHPCPAIAIVHHLNIPSYMLDDFHLFKI